MTLYLRYSSEIEKDLERGNSFHYTGLDRSYTIEEVAAACNIDEDGIEFNEEAGCYVQELPGLCVFQMDSENLEDAIEEAKEFSRGDVYNSEDMPFWNILEGTYVGDCPEGDCIIVTKVLYSNN